MTPFEQFVSREYGRGKGADVSDIYDDAVSKWKQLQTTEVAPNARAAQEMFQSLPDSLQSEPTMPVGQSDKIDLAKNQGVAPSTSSFDLSTLMTSNNRTPFDDLPDTQEVRSGQLTDLQIQQAKESAPQQSPVQQLPDELVNKTWNMFAQDHFGAAQRLSGPMKSVDRLALIKDFEGGYAENYEPILGMPLVNAVQIAERAMGEKRPISTSDWKMTEAKRAEQPVDLKQQKEAVDIAQGLINIGKTKEADEVLQKAGVVKQRNAFDDSMSLYGENQLLEAAKKDGRYTMEDGTVLDAKGIENKLAENKDKLSGLSSALAVTPSQKDKVININEFIGSYMKDDNSILPSSVNKMNEDIAALAKEKPDLMVIAPGGRLTLASKFKYEIGTPNTGQKELNPNNPLTARIQTANAKKDATRAEMEKAQKEGELQRLEIRRAKLPDEADAASRASIGSDATREPFSGSGMFGGGRSQMDYYNEIEELDARIAELKKALGKE